MSLNFFSDKDTLPTNTINAVDRVIDADKARPGFNGIPQPAIGQRYLSLTSYKGNQCMGS